MPFAWRRDLNENKTPRRRRRSPDPDNHRYRVSRDPVDVRPDRSASKFAARLC